MWIQEDNWAGRGISENFLRKIFRSLAAKYVSYVYQLVANLFLLTCKHEMTPVPSSSPSESAPKAFGIPLSQVIANDRAYKRRQDALKESRRDCLDLEASILRFRAEKRQFFNGNKPLVSSSSITGGGPCSPSANSVAPAPIFENQNKPLSPTFVDNSGRQRRVRHTTFCLSFFLYLICPSLFFAKFQV